MTDERRNVLAINPTTHIVDNVIVWEGPLLPEFAGYILHEYVEDVWFHWTWDSETDTFSPPENPIILP